MISNISLGGVDFFLPLHCFSMEWLEPPQHSGCLSWFRILGILSKYTLLSLQVSIGMKMYESTSTRYNYMASKKGLLEDSEIRCWRNPPFNSRSDFRGPPLPETNMTQPHFLAPENGAGPLKRRLEIPDVEFPTIFQGAKFVRFREGMLNFQAVCFGELPATFGAKEAIKKSWKKSWSKRC